MVVLSGFDTQVTTGHIAMLEYISRLIVIYNSLVNL